MANYARTRPHWRAGRLALGGLPWFVAFALLGCGDSAEPPQTAIEAEACVGCHAGIEQAHPGIGPGRCTVCHGGDPGARNLEGAHVAPAVDLARLRGAALPPTPPRPITDLPSDLLDQVDPAYLRFVNPGDIRILDETCGRPSCHANHASAVRASVMTTNAGHYLPTRKYAGLQDDRAHYASRSVRAAEGASGPGEATALAPLRPLTGKALDDALRDGDSDRLEEVAYDHYLAKNCNHCHAASYGRGNARGAYRSTGCTACHVLYNADGTYEGGDAAVPRDATGYPRRHEITTAIPTEQCATCHYQGGRIGLLFRGIREAGFASTPPPPFARPAFDGEEMFGHPAGYYLEDEDARNSIDETPPDLHYQAGLHCADCHVGSDVHGDGRLAETAKLQVDIACEDCHGTVRRRASPGSDGLFRTKRGRPLRQLSLRNDGAVVLTARLDGAEHVVPQPADLLAPGGTGTDYMRRAMGVDDHGWSHTDSLTCDACHSMTQVQCLGCHVTVDFRERQLDRQTGRVSRGATHTQRDFTSLFGLLLARGVDGRAQPTSSSSQVQMTIIDPSGAIRLGALVSGPAGEAVLGRFRHNDQFPLVIGFAPFFQHTTSRAVRPCSSCHPRGRDRGELRRVRGVYGFGTGEFLLANPDGPPVDALQFLDENGRQIRDFIHRGTGALEAERIERALAVTICGLEPCPGEAEAAGSP